MSPVKILSICMLLFLIFPTSAFQVIYEIQEGNFSKCGGEAKYLLKVQIFTEENGVLKPKVDSIKPCDPTGSANKVYHGRNAYKTTNGNRCSEEPCTKSEGNREPC